MYVIALRLVFVSFFHEYYNSTSVTIRHLIKLSPDINQTCNISARPQHQRQHIPAQLMSPLGERPCPFLARPHSRRLLLLVVEHEQLQTRGAHPPRAASISSAQIMQGSGR